MKTLILLLLTTTTFSQNYSFTSIDHKMPDLSWRKENKKGIISVNKDVVVVEKGAVADIYSIFGSQRFIRHNDIIFSCFDGADNRVNIRFTNWTDDGKYVDMYFYSDIMNEKYIRYCLTKIE